MLGSVRYKAGPDPAAPRTVPQRSCVSGKVVTRGSRVSAGGDLVVVSHAIPFHKGLDATAARHARCPPRLLYPQSLLSSGALPLPPHPQEAQRLVFENRPTEAVALLRRALVSQPSNASQSACTMVLRMLASARRGDCADVAMQVGPAEARHHQLHRNNQRHYHRLALMLVHKRGAGRAPRRPCVAWVLEHGEDVRRQERTEAQ